MEFIPIEKRLEQVMGELKIRRDDLDSIPCEELDALLSGDEEESLRNLLSVIHVTENLNAIADKKGSTGYVPLIIYNHGKQVITHPDQPYGTFDPEYFGKALEKTLHGPPSILPDSSFLRIQKATGIPAAVAKSILDGSDLTSGRAEPTLYQLERLLDHANKGYVVCQSFVPVYLHTKSKTQKPVKSIGGNAAAEVPASLVDPTQYGILDALALADTILRRDLNLLSKAPMLDALVALERIDSEIRQVWELAGYIQDLLRNRCSEYDIGQP